MFEKPDSSCTGNPGTATVFRRYVAVGDSSTEGLVDPAGDGGFRGFADRLAEILAAGQAEPLEYANLAVRGLKLGDIRETQFDPALALEPDLLSIFGGPNDIIATVRCDWQALRDHLTAMFGAARRRGITVLTFTLPDFTAANPLGATWRPRACRLNQLIRSEAERHEVLFVDFERHPRLSDPRLWCGDRLHANAIGHELLAAALAWRLGVAGATGAWSDGLPEEPVRAPVRQRLISDVDWLVHHLGPWLGSGIRGVRDSGDLAPKRPVPTVVARAPNGSPPHLDEPSRLRPAAGCRNSASSSSPSTNRTSGRTQEVSASTARTRPSVGQQLRGSGDGAASPWDCGSSPRLLPPHSQRSAECGCEDRPLRTGDHEPPS